MKQKALLTIKNLSVQSGGKQIIRDLSLTLKSGEIHVLMGPNGSGKSTLAYTLLAHPDYTVTAGQLFWQDTIDLLLLSADQRAKLGMFLGFQYPKEIPGVPFAQLLRLMQNKQTTGKTFDASLFLRELKERLRQVGLSEQFLSRSVNDNASGGEKKRLETVQLLTMQPKLAILDEIDSGLDIDALQSIAASIQKLQTEQRTAFLIITHYQRILRYLKPDHVHVLVRGGLVQSGNATLADQLEKNGYQKWQEEGIRK